MEIYLKQGHTFSVPVTVADHLLGLASHGQLKVLLYILCHADESLSAERIAQSCKVSTDAVEEAVAFWQDANVLLSVQEQPVLRLTEQASAPQPVAMQPAVQEPTVPVQPVPTELPQLQISSSNFSLLPSEIAARVQESKALAEMFRSAEQYAGRLLNNTEQKSLIWMHEYLGLEPDMILLLAAYCAETGCFHSRAMERIALDWQEQGIRDSATALEDIKRRTDSRSFTGQIRTLFEMHRQPTEKQQGYIDKWHKNGYSIDLVRFAYEKTRDQNDDKLSFPYLDKILTNWAKSGVRSVADAKRLDEAFRAGKQQNTEAEKHRKKPAKSGAEDASFDLADFDQLVNRF